MEELKRFTYYATFQNQKSGMIRGVVDQNSHPFIWRRIQMEFGQYWTLLDWKEITRAEYEYYVATPTPTE